jgi:hypothetical protein
MKKADAQEPETFAEVKAAMDKALGKPKRDGGIFLYKQPNDAPATTAWIKRVHAAGGSASLAAAYPKRVLAVVDGPPSGLMDLVTWVSWQSKTARKALDLLDEDAGLRVANINYTDFVIRLDRVPKHLGSHAKRLAKHVMMGDEKKIAASLKDRRWRTG